MTATTPEPAENNRLGWLMDDFVVHLKAALVAHAIVVSVDGLVVGRSRSLPTDRAEQLASTTSGLLSLAQGAARAFEAGEVNRTVVDMQGGVWFVESVMDKAILSVLAHPQCDRGLIGYQMGLWTGRVGEAIEPAVRTSGTNDQQ